MICPHCQKLIEDEVFEASANLSRTERLLLNFMYHNRNRVLTRADIFEGVWGQTYHGLSNIVEVYIRYLREKLGQNVILTVRGKGYMMPEVQA